MVAKSAQPSNIATQEQVLMWAIMAMEEAAPRAALLERPNVVQYQYEWETYKNPEGKVLFTGRFTVELDRSIYESGSAKPWMAAQETTSTPTSAIPSYYAAG